MRAIIIAAGEGTRWGNHLGVPKHLIRIEGEPILHRTVRLLRKHGVKDVNIVAKDRTDYAVAGAQVYVPLLNPKNGDADKFLSSRALWGEVGKTVILYGDVYFTDDAIDQIVNSPRLDWTLFCRPEGSEITGAKWGECFAFSFLPMHVPAMEKALDRIVDLWQVGLIDRNGGWELYRAMIGRKTAEIRRPHIMGSNYSVIDDWTEDFDTPEDYNNFIERLNKWLKK